MRNMTLQLIWKKIQKCLLHIYYNCYGVLHQEVDSKISIFITIVMEYYTKKLIVKLAYLLQLLWSITLRS